MSAEYGDVRAWVGDDDRDTLSADPDQDARCLSCGCHQSEPCTAECGCATCRRREQERREQEGPHAA